MQPMVHWSCMPGFFIIAMACAPFNIQPFRHGPGLDLKGLVVKYLVKNNGLLMVHSSGDTITGSVCLAGILRCYCWCWRPFYMEPSVLLRPRQCRETCLKQAGMISRLPLPLTRHSRPCILPACNIN